MLEEKGSRVLATGVTTDKIINVYGWGNENKLLKFVVAKGRGNDWCVYIEAMDRDQSLELIKKWGNKITPTTAKILVDCDNEVLGRYRI